MNTLSVLVTFYNQEQYVDNTLKSIIDQKTNFDFDIIISDDGSNDKTVDIIREWQNKYPERISMFIRDRNDGITVSGFRASRSRLELLKHVTGKYFIFLDGDDYFSDDKKLQKQVDILENPDNMDCVACSHYIEALYPDGHTIRFPNYELPAKKYTLNEYWPYLYFHTDTTLVRTEIIPKINTKYVINNFNDNLITYIVMQFGKIYFTPENMAVYYQTGDGIWTSRKKIVNYIRNMFLYDICNYLNPNLEVENDIRSKRSWDYLIKHTDEIKIDELDVFAKEAKERNLKFSLMFINYNSLSKKDRKEIKSKYSKIKFRFYIYKLKQKLFS